MRAMSRRTSFTRLGFSSWLVAAWKRRLNASRFRLPSSSPSWSSVLVTRSERRVSSFAILCNSQMRGVAETGNDLHLDRQLHRCTAERDRGDVTRDAVELEQDTARLDARGPIFRRTLALAHANFGRL